ncbi:hypothetical protein NHJ13051_004342 [Beauveria bassiana]
MRRERFGASQVSIVGGGGSGHEPAWSGYVGSGLLSAAACGDIFASPSASQVLAAMEAVPSEKGTILLITSYTGGRLQLGLAAEKARAKAAASGQYSNGKIAMKIVCSAAAENWLFDDCVRLAEAVNAETVSIRSALDHCHVPGRKHQSVAEDTCIIGAGIHNEPGRRMLTPFPPVDEMIKECLGLLCDQDDPERGFVKVDSGDEVVMLINNYGGLSILELGALTDKVQNQLAERYSLKPCRTMVGAFETSLNALGFSISLANLSAAARQCDSLVADATAWRQLLATGIVGHLKGDGDVILDDPVHQELLKVKVKEMYGYLFHSGINDDRTLRVAWPSLEDRHAYCPVHCSGTNAWTNLLSKSAHISSYAYMAPQCLQADRGSPCQGGWEPATRLTQVHHPDGEPVLLRVILHTVRASVVRRLIAIWHRTGTTITQVQESRDGATRAEEVLIVCGWDP